MNNLGATRLKGKVAFITGGLRGIGLAVAERYLAEGAEVIMSDLDAANSDHAGAIMARLGQAASYLRADVTNEADWIAAREFVQQRHKRLDIIVNNAGTDLTGPVESLALESWRKIMAINVDGVFLGTKTFVPMLAESGTIMKGGSSVINVSSIMGLVGYTDTSAYNASKGAVRLFTKSIAVEFATKKMPIRANSIHPGFVVTPLLHAGFQRWVEKGFAEKPQDLIDSVAASTPIGRLADPSEIASAAFFLASSDSSYMTGAELVVDGGWTAQ
jgi:NAD(P)-dependent dehydrogenase (short-subunit alcohol dehydrogenase family)